MTRRKIWQNTICQWTSHHWILKGEAPDDYYWCMHCDDLWNTSKGVSRGIHPQYTRCQRKGCREERDKRYQNEKCVTKEANNEQYGHIHAYIPVTHQSKLLPDKTVDVDKVKKLIHTYQPNKSTELSYHQEKLSLDLPSADPAPVAKS